MFLLTVNTFIKGKQFYLLTGKISINGEQLLLTVNSFINGK